MDALLSSSPLEDGLLEELSLIRAPEREDKRITTSQKILKYRIKIERNSNIRHTGGGSDGSSSSSSSSK